MPRVIVLLLAVVIAMAILLGLIVKVGVSRLARLDARTDQPISRPAPDSTAATLAFPAAVTATQASNPPALASGEFAPEPRPIEPPAANPIVLPAAAAQLHGESIRMQVQGGGAQNVGFWWKTGDSAEWNLDVPHAGKYHVEMTYACNTGNGGGVYEMTVARHHFTGTATPTGSWEDYQTLNVGDLTLAEGRTRIVLKPLRLDPDKSLMNVRSVRLVPINP